MKITVEVNIDHLIDGQTFEEYVGDIIKSDIKAKLKKSLALSRVRAEFA